MSLYIERAIKQSSGLFVDHVWPVISPAIGGGELVPVETVTESGFARDLDTLAGVDAWQVSRPDGMRPIASRVQQSELTMGGYRPWNTFTIRYTRPSGSLTEFHKRLTSIRDGFLHPHLTVQAYLDTFASARLLSVAVVDTASLYAVAASWVEQHGDEPDLWKWRDGCKVKNVTGGSTMLVVDWRLVESSDTAFYWRHDVDQAEAA